MYKLRTSRMKYSYHGGIIVLCCLMIVISGCSNIFINTSSTSGKPSSISVSTSHASTKADANGIQTEAVLRAQLTKAQQIIDGMTLDQKLGQLIIVEYFHSDYPTTLQYMVSQQFVGGYLYQPINGNFNAPSDTISGVKNFAAQANRDAKIPLLIAIDQEGGYVNKLGDNFYGPEPSAAEMTAKGNPSYAFAQGAQVAQQMGSTGINTDLAPVVDVGPTTNLLVTRQFSDNPNTVATYAGAFIDGLQSNGTIGCLKHFPGLGSLPVGSDPHNTLPVINKSKSDLENVDWVPYKTMIQHNHPAMIMSTDVVDSAIDSTLPAELSPKMINGVLRSELGYNGVIITDGLYMGGIQAKWSIAQASVLAIVAGNDLVEGAFQIQDVASIIQALKDAIQQGKLSMQQVNKSLQRILLMKMQYGILK